MMRTDQEKQGYQVNTSVTYGGTIQASNTAQMIILSQFPNNFAHVS